MTKITRFLCEYEGGEPLLEMRDDKIIALQDCIVSFNGSEPVSVKKGSSMEIPEQQRLFTPVQANNLTDMSFQIFGSNLDVGWWDGDDMKMIHEFRKTGKLTKNLANLILAKLALCHSETSEALEGVRKGLMDDHLPHRPMVEVELADTIIRILDLAGFMGLDIGAALAEKYAYNQTRADHKKENREKAGGKTV